jgi:hypothetical protein
LNEMVSVLRNGGTGTIVIFLKNGPNSSNYDPKGLILLSFSTIVITISTSILMHILKYKQ